MKFFEKRYVEISKEKFQKYEDGLYSGGECGTYEEALQIVTKALAYNKETKIVWTNED